MKLLGLSIAALLSAAAQAHGIVGQRFFPATLATEDPFVADELSLPTVASTRHGADEEGAAHRRTAFSVDFARRLTPDLGIEASATRLRIAPDGQPAVSGWDNLGVGIKYQLYRNDERESVVSIGADWDIGATGSRSVGAERFSTVTPTLYFGKGFGNLSSPALRPLAVTGTLGVSIPSRASTTSTEFDADSGLPTTTVERHPHVLSLGLALEYSVPYLQSRVVDAGLGAPFNRLIPVLELALAKPLDKADDRGFTGTFHPGVLWAGQKVQWGLEAVIPMNSRSGHGIGWIAQLHLFLDDVFPGTFGRPVFGDAR